MCLQALPNLRNKFVANAPNYPKTPIVMIMIYNHPLLRHLLEQVWNHQGSRKTDHRETLETSPLTCRLYRQMRFKKCSNRIYLTGRTSTISTFLESSPNRKTSTFQWHNLNRPRSSKKSREKTHPMKT